MHKAGNAASSKRSSEASFVSFHCKSIKIKRRSIRVVGSSFITSTKTRRKAVKTLVFKIGIWILVNTFFFDAPSDLADSSSPGFIAERPESIVLRDMDKNRNKIGKYQYYPSSR
ncbi:MAG: hypothetical protein CM15mP51_16950 [Porticoccaceae bacterium]|nr:MAG: hypothetical protein CM15mP51_16950 [Porticoccaceae bacterium]